MPKGLTQDEVKTLFEYKDGSLYWKIKPSKKIHINSEAGYTERDGYRRVRIHKQNYPTHRLIFLYFNGYMPKFIDHKDGNRSNNNLDNLRECTAADNQHNRKNQIKFVSTCSKWKGVCWIKHRKRWMARIKVNYKSIYVGYFTDEDDAARAYNEAAKKYFGEFAHLNAVD
jgi:hypothetical protein